MTRFLSIDQAAELLSLSRDFIERHKRELGAVKAGRVYRIPESGIEDWVRRNTLPPVPPRPIRIVETNALIARARREAR